MIVVMTDCASSARPRLVDRLVPFALLVLALFVMAAAASAGAAFAAPQPAEAPSSYDEETNVLAIDLPVAVRNRTGAAPGKLEPGSLVITEDGEARPVVGIARLGSAPGAEPWRLVLVFDMVTSQPGTVKAAALNLAERAQELVDLGSVEIRLANPEVQTFLEPTRDPLMVENALARILVEYEGKAEVAVLRRDVIEKVNESLRSEGGSLPGGMSTAELAAAAMEEEKVIVLGMQDHLLRWAATAWGAGQAAQPRAMLLITEGFDLDPGRFYRRELGEARDLPSSADELQAATQAFARAMAASGWVVFPLSFHEFGSGPSEPSERFERFRRLSLDGPKGEKTAVGGFTVQLGRKNQASEAEERPVLLSPAEPLQVLARETGGAAVTKVVGLPDVVTSLGQWYRVTFQTSRELDGRLHPVEVESRGVGTSASAPAWVRSGTPEAVAEARVRRIVRGEYEVGDLAVLARPVPSEPNQIEVSLDLVGTAVRLPDPGSSPLRVTLAYGAEGKRPTFQHRILTGQDLAGSRWTERLPLDAPAGTEYVIVVVEELYSGAWGARDVSL